MGFASFNPGVREGRDKPFGIICLFHSVSIHASARDATSGSRTTAFWYLFQSTRPRGTRRAAAEQRPSGICFNPRVREGRDAGALHAAGG